MKREWGKHRKETSRRLNSALEKVEYNIQHFSSKTDFVYAFQHLWKLHLMYDQNLNCILYLVSGIWTQTAVNTGLGKSARGRSLFHLLSQVFPQCLLGAGGLKYVSSIFVYKSPSLSSFITTLCSWQLFSQAIAGLWLVRSTIKQ